MRGSYPFHSGVGGRQLNEGNKYCRRQLITERKSLSFSLPQTKALTEQEELQQMQKNKNKHHPAGALAPPQVTSDRSCIYMSFTN